MHRCLQLAKKGLGNVAPNPMVGAILVHKDVIIGEGYHESFGSNHAEVNCIQSVTSNNHELIKDSTLYVSLEPCNHFGKTPPCTNCIIQHGIKEVVIACMDSFEKVNGSGIKKLKEAGIKVTIGVLEKEALALNKRFFTFHTLKRPYIILKWAQTNNGMIAGEMKQRIKISNDSTNKLVHQWRSQESGIFVGTYTAELDNPSLTTRLWTGKNPLRIFIDKDLRISQSSNLLDNSTPTLILNRLEEKKIGNTIFVKYDETKRLIPQLNAILYDKGISSLIVEGGSTLLQSFINENIWDEARIITNKNMEVLNGLDSPIISKKNPIKVESIFHDEIVYYSREGL